MEGTSGKVVFKTYNQRQPTLFPPSLDSLIPDGHLVRLVDSAIEQIDLSPVLDSYKGGGTSSYHPKMLLKVLVYAYSQKIYTSRQIAKAIGENIHFMWLCGGNKPDFRTINRFRTSRLRNNTEKIFASMLELMAEAKLINLEEYFLDGTKIEANANRYSFVWKKSTKRYAKNLDTKVKELFSEIDQLNKAEDSRYGSKDLPETGEDFSPVTAEQMEDRLNEIEKILEESAQPLEKQQKRKLKKAGKQLRDDLIPRKKKYDRQLELFDERNSYSKTDTDATFMRMKEDHMRNGQLKPGYNVQVGTENQIITGYSIHQKSTDTSLLTPHLDKVENSFGFKPKTVIADAGYGSEENYQELDSRSIEAYVKYGSYDQEKKRSHQWKQQFYPEGMDYDDQRDQYICPAGKRLSYIGDRQWKASSGFLSHRRAYRADDCTDCELRECCNRGQGSRSMEVNQRLMAYRERAKKLLGSEKGAHLRKRRLCEVESVFGQIKQNFGIRKFILRGVEKVTLEFGLIAMGHNMRKWHKMALEGAR